MDELTLIELHVDGISFGNNGADDTDIDSPDIEASEDISESVQPDSGRGMGRRIGRALAVTVVLSLIARSVIGRVRGGSDEDTEAMAADDPEVVSVDAPVAEQD